MTLQIGLTRAEVVAEMVTDGRWNAAEAEALIDEALAQNGGEAAEGFALTLL